MNIAMEQTEEYVNGQLKAKYGDTFIRGNNGMWQLTVPTARVRTCLMIVATPRVSVLYISTQKKKA